MTHTERDSLLYLRHSVTHLLDYATETIAGQFTDNPDEELPDHIEKGIDLLDAASRIIRYEAQFHNATGTAYSTGHPAHVLEDHPVIEKTEEGIPEIRFLNAHTDLYPDGGRIHPLFRKTHSKDSNA